jgi:hypothetical protein
VFALDHGGSQTQVKNSPLLNASHVTFVFGPTQRTLPKQVFTRPHQLVLLDGPHGYPFPDLEYFYFYPTIAVGGVLAIDDILIPTIGRMVDILRADKMFSLLEIVDDNMAIFERTEHPQIDPEGDGWWIQGFNEPYYEHVMSLAAVQPGIFRRACRKVIRLLPRRLKQAVPAAIKHRLQTYL